MTVDEKFLPKACAMKGWRNCDGNAVTACVVCAKPLCKRCFGVLKVYIGGHFVARCTDPFCRQAIVLRETYRHQQKAGLL